MDFITLLGGGLTLTGIAYYAPSILKNMALHKKLVSLDNDTDLRIMAIPESIYRDHEAIQLKLHTLDDEMTKTVEEFETTLGKVEWIDLSNLRRNFKSYNIKKEDAPNHFNYDIVTMRIEIGSENVREMLIMGLLYLAATDNFFSTNASGFIRKTPEFKLGYGISRGYTEILAARHFGIKFDTMANDMIDDFAGVIEVIVGQKKMESAFFKGALNTLIDELAKYSSPEEAVRTIREIDHMETAIKLKSNLAAFLASPTYKNLHLRLIRMLEKKIEMLGTDELDEMGFAMEIMLDFLHASYWAGVKKYSLPKREIENTSSLMLKKLENRGISVKID